ncbi:MAG TPA: carboxylesterase [Spongiibacteraceae bacterium]|nr:carboxylesterase [Spongiibacteraceae bacterium]HCS26833.1 carboxylesterase [Spongiibacteraceae bacterium]
MPILFSPCPLPHDSQGQSPSNRRWLKILALCSAACLSTLASGAVKTTSGKVSGIEEQGIIAYKGIPYAAPPVGKLRWKAPQPPRKWKGVRKADSYGATCPQTPAPWEQGPLKYAHMSEDCLFLNVYTPQTPSDKPLPVMVWIHGGGFSWGSSEDAYQHGSGLVPQGVILVTFNYRLGPLGSFDYPGLNSRDKLRGNYQLMDQQAALKWVQRNIAAFGGNEENVTLFGDSAGGWSVMGHLSSPKAKGLFHKAIVQSGTFNTMPSRQLATSKPGLPSLQDIGRHVAEQLGLEGDDIAEQLRQVPAQKLIEVGLSPFGQMSYGPVADGKLLPEDPLKAWPVRIENPVPIIMGLTSLEGVLMSLLTNAELKALLAPYDERELTELYGKQPFREIARLVWEDRMSYEPTRRYLRAAAAQAPAIYSYHFDYVAQSMAGALPGAPHGTDVPYVFRTLDIAAKEDPMPGYSVADKDRQVSDIVSAYWVEFAKSGNPNKKGLPTWPRYTDKTEITLEIGDTFQQKPAFLARRLDFYSTFADKSEKGSQLH